MAEPRTPTEGQNASQTSPTPDATARSPEATDQGPPRDELGRFMAAHGIPDEGEPQAAPGQASAQPDKGTEPLTSTGESVATKPTPKGRPQPEETEKSSGGDGDTPAAEGEWTGPSERQRRMAKQIGYTDAEIDGFEPAAWPHVEQCARNEAARLSREANARRRTDADAEPGRTRQAQQPPDSPREPTAAEDGQPVTLAGLRELAAEHWAEDPAFNGLLDYIEQRETAAAEKEQAVIDTREDGEFDGWFTKQMDKDGTPLYEQFGAGTMDQVGEDSPEGQARIDFAEEVRMLRKAYLGSGRDCTLAEACEYVASNRFRDQQRQQARSEVERRVSERHKAAVPRSPGRMASPPVTRDRKFDAAMDDFERARGVKIPAE